MILIDEQKYILNVPYVWKDNCIFIFIINIYFSYLK